MFPPEFPAGPYVCELPVAANRRDELIHEVEELPEQVRQLIGRMNDSQLDTRYKNWTVRQIVHHLADSHVNGYVRFRLALTEDRPTIKDYDRSGWAELSDSKTADVELSLRLLESLHARWAVLVRTLTDCDFERTYFHPKYQREVRLDETLALYAHHCRHHCAQIAWLQKSS
jgi:hypothetical protein